MILSGTTCLSLPEQACIQLVTGALPCRNYGKDFSSPLCKLGYRFLLRFHFETKKMLPSWIFKCPYLSSLTSYIVEIWFICLPKYLLQTIRYYSGSNKNYITWYLKWTNLRFIGKLQKQMHTFNFSQNYLKFLAQNCKIPMKKIYNSHNQDMPFDTYKLWLKMWM